MPDYIVASLRYIPIGNELVKMRDYIIFNSDDSTKNRKEATELYERISKHEYTISVVFSKIIESKAFPERLK